MAPFFRLFRFGRRRQQHLKEIFLKSIKSLPERVA